MEVQSALIGAFVTVAVMTGMLLRRRRRRSDVLFALVCVVLGAWFLAAFLRGNFGLDPWLRVEIAIGALLPAVLVQLFVDLLPWLPTGALRLRVVSFSLSGLSALLALSPLGHLPEVQVGITGYIGAGILLAGWAMVSAPESTGPTVEHTRRRYLAVGAALAAMLAIGGQVPGAPAGWTAAGHLAVTLYVFFLSQIILRERLLDLNELLGRMLILGILAVLFATISATLIGLGTDDGGRLFNAVVGVIILLTLYEPLKDRLEAKVMDLFFRERNLLHSVLDDLAARMHGSLEPERMAQLVVDTVYGARRATHVAVYLLDPAGAGFARRAHRGPEPALRVSGSDIPALWQAIQLGRPILADHRAAETAEAEEPVHRELVEALRAVSADLLFPFVSGKEVLGFLAVRDDRSVEPYTAKEVAQFTKVADTAATVIWNSKLAERLRERERLAAIGAMAAGLAHEIRNPLGAIKGAAEYLDPKDGPADPEMLRVIVEEVNRLDSVVSQFLDYARPFRGVFAKTDLNDVVRRTARLIAAQRSGDRLLLELDRSLPPIEADGEQLKQVILNLVLNALDASRETLAPVRIRTESLRSRRAVELRVIDEGVGIPLDELERIFIPFFTTKHQGTGLGLAVCHRIVMSHGGSIHPESVLGSGTDFVIRLPLDARDRPPEARPLDPLPRVRAREPS